MQNKSTVSETLDFFHKSNLERGESILEPSKPCGMPRVLAGASGRDVHAALGDVRATCERSLVGFLRSLTAIFIIASCCSPAGAATQNQTQQFLRGYRHSWCPYALPIWTDLAEIEKVAAFGFDTVGITFNEPYNVGKIDFSKLDEAIDAVRKHGQRVVIYLSPRFLESDGISDRLDNGEVLPNIWNKSPNYAILDIFDPAQRRKCNDFLEQCAKRYGHHPGVASFVLGWGYMGETGFYIGDFIGDPAAMGARCAGYSPLALQSFNRWRMRRRMTPLKTLPLPSTSQQSRDYLLFHQFRAEFVRDEFQKGMVSSVKAHTRLPVGVFGYIAASPDSCARDWASTPNADYYRTAGSASSFDMNRTLIDSGYGWEDNGLHDGKWDFSAACMKRDEARQIARGGVFHAMYIRAYETEPQWERGLFPKIAAFLRTVDLDHKVRRLTPTIALFQPTWGATAFPAKSETQKFTPRPDYSLYAGKMIGLAESFGLPYQLITEADLMQPHRLRRFQHIIVPMWDLMPLVIGNDAARALGKDRRVVKIPLKPRALTRSEFRAALQKAHVPTTLDFDADTILAGRTANLVYNWDDKPIQVQVPEQKTKKIDLKPYEYRVISSLNADRARRLQPTPKHGLGEQRGGK